MAYFSLIASIVPIFAIILNDLDWGINTGGTGEVMEGITVEENWRRYWNS